jgi:hypothetical protein
MRVRDLLENDEWENTKPVGKFQQINWLKQKMKAVQHQETVLDDKFEAARKANPDDLLIQNFPIDDKEDVIPSQVFNDFKAFTHFDMVGCNAIGHELGRTRVFVRNNRPELIALAKMFTERMPGLVQKQYQIEAELKAVWKQGQKQS